MIALIGLGNVLSNISLIFIVLVTALTHPDVSKDVDPPPPPRRAIHANRAPAASTVALALLLCDRPAVVRHGRPTPCPPPEELGAHRGVTGEGRLKGRYGGGGLHLPPPRLFVLLGGKRPPSPSRRHRLPPRRRTTSRHRQLPWRPG